MSQLVEVKVPDIGDFKDIPVIDIPIKVGDSVSAEDSLVTLESDKATMDVPSPVSGEVVELKVKLGDRISEGVVVAIVKVGAGGTAAVVAMPATTTTTTTATVTPAPAAVPAAAPAVVSASAAPPTGQQPTPLDMLGASPSHASPSVRRFARELGVNLAKVKGTGPKARILQDDVQAYVKGVMNGQSAVPSAPTSSGGGCGLDLLPWPKVDFAKFGPVEVKALSRIQKISGANLARNWVVIPHVTQFDDADITDLEAFRVAMNKENEKGGGAKLTMLAFLIKASVSALKKFPNFNASLDGDNLVLKQYFHVGFAADTPNGLVVPVLKNADQKGVLQIAQEMGDLAKKARDGKLGPTDMQGGCFSISSLGGIGGTAFTPIINAPEVAILGVSKTQTKPVWDGKAFVPRQILPLSLSYDHRVIDGAAAARFTTYLGQVLADMRRVML